MTVMTPHPAKQQSKLGPHVYSGSVKEIFQVQAEPNTLAFAFTDDYSVFDYGKMPDTIAQKGASLTLMGGLFFDALSDPFQWQALDCALEDNPLGVAFEPKWLDNLLKSPLYETYCDTGCPNHFMGWISEANEPVTEEQWGTQAQTPFLKVQAAHVVKPTATDSGYDYGAVVTAFKAAEQQEAEALQFVPLEVVFRFGMPQGSSLLKRLENDATYYKTLGLSKPPSANNWFERPVVEFFSKLEPHDRWLSQSDAQAITGLSDVQLAQLEQTTLLIALFLFDSFGARGMALWDGKLEFAYRPSDKQFVLVDAIGPDELRLIYKEVHLSKELLRQYYKSTDWFAAFQNEGKQGEAPPPICPDFKQLVDQLYPALVNSWAQQRFFDTIHTLPELVDALKLATHTSKK